MRARLLLAAAAALIFVLALLNLAAERLHWQRGELLHPRSELFHQTQLRAESGTSVHAAPLRQHRLTAAGASGPADHVWQPTKATVRPDSPSLAFDMLEGCWPVYRLGISCLTQYVCPRRRQHHIQTAQQVPCGRHGGRLGVRTVAGPCVLLALPEAQEGASGWRCRRLHTPAAQVTTAWVCLDDNLRCFTALAPRTAQPSPYTVTCLLQWQARWPHGGDPNSSGGPAAKGRA